MCCLDSGAASYVLIERKGNFLVPCPNRSDHGNVDSGSFAYGVFLFQILRSHLGAPSGVPSHNLHPQVGFGGLANGNEIGNEVMGDHCPQL